MQKRLARVRKLGQGMTEYIVIVGLVAILLIAAVVTYKEQIRITIEGSAAATNGINNGINGGSTGAAGPGSTASGSTPDPTPYTHPTDPSYARNGESTYTYGGARYFTADNTAVP